MKAEDFMNVAEGDSNEVYRLFQQHLMLLLLLAILLSGGLKLIPNFLAGGCGIWRITLQ